MADMPAMIPDQLDKRPRLHLSRTTALGQLVGSVCGWPAKDGINTLGLKYRVNPGVQLLDVSSQHLSMIGLQITVEASLKQPEQRLSLTSGFSLGFALDAPMLAFLCHDRHHR